MKGVKKTRFLLFGSPARCVLREKRITGEAHYDADGKADIAIGRPSDGTWYVHKSSDGSLMSLQWGGGYAPYHDYPIPSFWTPKRGRY